MKFIIFLYISRFITFYLLKLSICTLLNVYNIYIKKYMRILIGKIIMDQLYISLYKYIKKYQFYKLC